jgi:hypothetical protein
MEQFASGDWEGRLKAYQNILDLMQHPSADLLLEMQRDLPVYLADINPACQAVALTIGDLYLKSGFEGVNFNQIAGVLIASCLGVKQNSDSASDLLQFCLHQATDPVLDQLLRNIVGKSKSVALAILAILVDHLATLTPRDADEVTKILERLQTLTAEKSTDEQIHRELVAAVASAKIVLGSDLETGPLSPHKETKPPEQWAKLITSDNWKDRKTGYDELLDSISEGSNLQLIEHHFLVQASAEKYTMCEVLVAQIIDKMAAIFKGQLARKLREYVTPIIALLGSKRQSRIQVFQRALDSIAANVVTNPFEPPFVEHLLKMMTSSSLQLREESLNFIHRNGLTNFSPPIAEQVKIMTLDQAASVRKLAAALVEEESLPSKQTTKKSSVSRNKRFQNAQTSWENWVEPPTLELLTNSSTWTAVTKGLAELKRQFDADPSQPSAVVLGLAGLFIGKTFTPKVMSNIMSNLLYIMRFDPEKLSDEAITQAVQFSLDKIQDKKFEAPVFEILDVACETNSSQFVFQILYQHLIVKNPMIPLRIATFIAHHLETYGSHAGINLEELAEQIKPLFSHGDSSIRKMAAACLKAVRDFDQTAANEFFKYAAKQTDAKPPEPQQKPPDLKPSKLKPEIPRPPKVISPRHSDAQLPSFQLESFIPPRLVQGVQKAGSILETRKALDEVETLLATTTPCSVHCSEFVDFLAKLRQWFKDSNTTIILSITKVISLFLKIVIRDEIETIPNEFFGDMCLLLNFAHKGIRISTVNALTQLFAIHPSFIPSIFLPSFFKLNTEGRKTAIAFLKNMQSGLEMTIEDYSSFIMNLLLDKNEDFRESAKPIIQQFFLLPNSMGIAVEMANQLSPAQKSLVLSRLTAFQATVSYFKTEPTQEERHQREQALDRFLPLKVLNSEAQPEELTEVLQIYSEFYFTTSIIQTDADTIHRTCEMFMELARQQFNSFSIILDIVFLWWASQALSIRISEGFTEIIEFLGALLEILSARERVLEKFEFSILLPTILECIGRDESQWNDIRTQLLRICDDGDLLDVLIYILSVASSVFTIVATFKTLKILIPQNDVSQYLAELTRWTTKIHGIVELDQAGNKELFNVSLDFMNFLQTLTATPKPPPKRPQKELPKQSAIPVPKFGRRPQKMAPETEPADQPKRVAVSVCSLNEVVTKMLESPELLLYQWIADVSAPDVHVSIAALKSISSKLKKEAAIFARHVDPLMMSLLAKMQSQFAVSPLPVRMCKYVSFSVLTLRTETRLTVTISEDMVWQLVAELLRNLSAGLNEPILNQALNAIVLKLIEDSPLTWFRSFLKVLGDSAQEAATEKRVKLALKCFEALGLPLGEVGHEADKAAAVEVSHNFIIARADLEQSPIGERIATAVKQFHATVTSREQPSQPEPEPEPVH